MKTYQVLVSEVIEEVIRDRNDNFVEKTTRFEPRKDLGFSVPADVPTQAARAAKEAFKAADMGKVLCIRSCSVGPKGVVRMAVCRHRVVPRQPSGWTWKSPPATPVE